MGKKAATREVQKFFEKKEERVRILKGNRTNRAYFTQLSIAKYIKQGDHRLFSKYRS